LWEGDGGLSLAGHATYDTASPRLAAEVQHLLLRLGIVARLYRRVRSYKGRELEHHVVTVTGKESLIPFWQRIGRRFRDPEKRRRSAELAARANGRMSRDIIPADVREIIRRQRDMAKLGWAEMGRKTGTLRRLAESDVYWDRIVRIEAMGNLPTYDLQIEGHHNFLANNLVVHNSHAASFALLVYVSAWIKRYEPEAFTCALLNSQPMGFYSPSQLTQDLRRHGGSVLPADATSSEWECTLETSNAAPALRLGLCLVKGLSQPAGERLVAARRRQPFAGVDDLARRAGLNAHD